MTHPVTEHDLSDLLDGRLTPEREREVRRALDERPELARLYARMLEQDRLLRRLGEDVLNEPVPEAMVELLRRAVKEAPQEPEAPKGDSDDRPGETPDDPSRSRRSGR